jgi:hypothetical protein
MKTMLLMLSLVVMAGCATTTQPPPPAAGLWDFTLNSQMGAVTAKVTMVVEDSALTGQFDLGNGRTWPIEDGTVDGNSIAFKLNRDGAQMTYVMTGNVEGDSIKGVAAAMGSTVEWSMSRSI